MGITENVSDVQAARRCGRWGIHGKEMLFASLES
jgi:hypothetical protein